MSTSFDQNIFQLTRAIAYLTCTELFLTQTHLFRSIKQSCRTCRCEILEQWLISCGKHVDWRLSGTYTKSLLTAVPSGNLTQAIAFSGVIWGQVILLGSPVKTGLEAFGKILTQECLMQQQGTTEVAFESISTDNSLYLGNPVYCWHGVNSLNIYNSLILFHFFIINVTSNKSWVICKFCSPLQWNKVQFIANVYIVSWHLKFTLDG